MGYYTDLHKRIRALEAFIIEGKKDQEILRDFLGDEYYDKFTSVKAKIKDPDYKDIYKLIKKDPDEVKSYIDSIKSNRDSRKADKSSGASLIYSDSDWNVYRITSYKAAQLYGKGTKWCITGRYDGYEEQGEEFFNDYIEDYDLDGGYYFFISKKDPSKKYCLLREDSGKIQSIWNAADNDLGDDLYLFYAREGVRLPYINGITDSPKKWAVSRLIKYTSIIYDSVWSSKLHRMLEYFLDNNKDADVGKALASLLQNFKDAKETDESLADTIEMLFSRGASTEDLEDLFTLNNFEIVLKRVLKAGFMSPNTLFGESTVFYDVFSLWLENIFIGKDSEEAHSLLNLIKFMLKIGVKSDSIKGVIDELDEYLDEGNLTGKIESSLLKLRKILQTAM